MWFGSGLTEHCRDVVGGKVFVEANEAFYRPADVNTLLGDSTKAREKLGWQPQYDLAGLVLDMCQEEMK